MVKATVTEIDRGWRKLRQTMKAASDAHAKVGVLAGKGAEESREGLTNAELAAVHEFGTKDGRVPERSFIRATVIARRVRNPRSSTRTKISRGPRRFMSGRAFVIRNLEWERSSALRS